MTTTNVPLDRGNRPVSFRRELTARVLKTLVSGESCSLVGVGSSGKSNVARHLARRDVLAYHLGNLAATRLSVLVDCNELVEYAPLALHVLILDALRRAIQDARSSSGGVADRVATLLDRAIESASAERARTNLKDAFDEVFRSGVEQVFILLDDFDHVVQNAPSPMLNSLRSFRDNHKRKLMYATFTRRELGYLRDQAQFQEFYELVAANTFAVGPYSDDDARAMVQQLSGQWTLAGRLSLKTVENLLAWSGNHPGLIRAMLMAMWHSAHINPAAPDALSQLQKHQDVVPECEHIWESLENEEKDALMAIVLGRPPTDVDALRPLEVKGLISVGLAGGYAIRSPVFAAFVAAQTSPSPGTAGVQADRPFEFYPGRNEVRINGYSIRDLDPVELSLLRRICERYPRPASRAELISDMQYSETVPRRYSGSTDARLSQYLIGLKRRLDLIKLDCLRIHPDGTCELAL